ncbi:BamA/TamA family outer membrane protein [Pedobacter nutrimenti]|uniref:BamA/TamA family outer membrane protein n=1 Tax=Pedobacter nutrimenti TaxID=1241337 RepID=UPI00292D93F3|nr:BamA/TamA family outer membrane protein [Pedobacter nutrimenti]
MGIRFLHKGYFGLLLSAVGFSSAGYAQVKAPGDSITVAIAPEYDQVSGTHRFFLGENYRKLWATPVKMRVLNLEKERGGLTIVKLGGGNQTRSLQFKDASGRLWALRTIQKYPERGLPENLRPTIAKNIVQDQVSTGHPFGALVVPPLAEALHIPHALPEIVYVGDDPGLMEYRKDFANAAYLFEERDPAEAEKTDKTEKVQRKLQEDNDKTTDQLLTLRARLLDFIVGDWDRHEDNWRWLPKKNDDGTLYEPIPRDRDKVFYRTSGVFPWILSHQWLKSNLQPYSENIRDINGWNFNARYFDRYFLNELNEKDWKEEVKYVQKTITPQLVDSAIKLMPAIIVAENGEELKRALNGRVHNLEKIALDYYHFLAEYVEIPASDKRERFEIQHKKDGQVELTVRNIKKDGSIGRKLYKRTFKQEQTKEIRIYGFGGNDVFAVNGDQKSNITVRMIGGDGVDQFEIAPEVKNRSHLYIYDRLDGGNTLPSSSQAKLRLSNDSTVNQYDKNSFVFNRFGPLFRVNYSIDQGLQIGAGLVYEKQGFRKAPYAFKHEFWATYTTGRSSFILNYSGDFKEAIGKNDLRIDANLLGPHNLSNFFGLGNETQFINEGDKEMPYYRNRYEYLTADVKLARNLQKNLNIEGGLSTEYYTSTRSSNDNRFLQDFDALHPEEQVFSDRFYAGVMGNLVYDTRDNIAIPTKGMYWKTGLSFKKEVNGAHDSYGKIQTEFRYYFRPGRSGVVIANRIGGGTTFGDPAFFQQMQLGGMRSLRGFHSNRFTGRTMAYHNLDLRVKLFNFTSYIVPGSVGLIAFNDIGRVWSPGEDSKKWHDGYGGGLYVVPAELFLIQAAVGFSNEGALTYISIGFNF